MCHLWWNFLSEEWNLSCSPLHWLHSTGSHCVLFGPHRCWPSEMSLKSAGARISTVAMRLSEILGRASYMNIWQLSTNVCNPFNAPWPAINKWGLILGVFFVLAVITIPTCEPRIEHLQYQSVPGIRPRRIIARVAIGQERVSQACEGCANEWPGETGWRRKWLQWRRSNLRLPPPPWTCTTWGSRSAEGVRKGSTT